MREVTININGEPKQVTIISKEQSDHGIHVECTTDTNDALHLVKTVNGAWMEQVDGLIKPSLMADLIGRQLDKKNNTVVNDDTFKLTVPYNGKEHQLSLTPLGDYYRVVQDGDFLFNIFPPDHLKSYWHASDEHKADGKFVEAVGALIPKY